MMARHRVRQSVAALTPLQAALINTLQADFPLCDRPFAQIGQSLGVAETEVLAQIRFLLDEGILTRFGPLFQVERMGGRFVLAALAVPETHFSAVAEQVNALAAVAHNYRRDHVLNMWFVLATETPEGIDEAVQAIEASTGLRVHLFPKEREYFVGMQIQAKAAGEGGA